MSVTPRAGTNSAIVTGGSAIEAAPGNINGGRITNPLTAADQGVGIAEPLYVNPVGAAAQAAGGTTFALAPGESWDLIPGQTTPTTVNAGSDGHKFSVIVY